MRTVESKCKFPVMAYLALAGSIMAYGWGYRGTVGHEAGAMVPGALLGMALALGSGRRDWHRRSLVVGLFSAIGYAWGGSLSYMEHTFYVSSDSFVDVLYGYTMLFFLGGMWAGIAGGGLGLALSEPRSELERWIRPFSLICGVFLLVHLYYFFNDETRETLETFTVRYFHDGDWLAAILVLATSGIYWLTVPKDRSGSALYFWGAVGWWLGYLALTKVGGLRLAPLHRSENWGGVLGILVVFLVYLARRQNRAALMMALYGILGGGIGFVLAVFARHPVMIGWGMFQAWPPMPVWRIAEVSFGLLMGLAFAIGSLRLLKGGLEPCEENTPRNPLDVFAAFVILIALIWINFRRHAVRLIEPIEAGQTVLTMGLPLWGWYCVIGVLMTLPVIFALVRCLAGDRELAPQSPFGKGVLIALLLLWITQLGYGLQISPSSQLIVGLMILLVPATLATLLLLRFGSIGFQWPDSVSVNRSDAKWAVGRKYALLWTMIPIFLIAVTGMTMGMQDAPYSASRRRFGPDAYWKQSARMLGTWEAFGRSSDLTIPKEVGGDLPVLQIEFDPYRNVMLTLPTGEIVSEAHRWFLKDQYTWLDWNSKLDDSAEKLEIPLRFHEGLLFISWPMEGIQKDYLVFRRVEN